MRKIILFIFIFSLLSFFKSSFPNQAIAQACSDTNPCPTGFRCDVDFFCSPNPTPTPTASAPTPTPGTANRCGYPPIPASISPSSGGDKDNYTLTIRWSQMTNDDFNEYANIGIVPWAIDNNAGGQDLIFDSTSPLPDYARSREDEAISLSNFAPLFLDETYSVGIHIRPDTIGSSNCQLELSPMQISVTGSYVDPGVTGLPTSGLNQGSACNPALQSDPNFQCADGTICKADDYDRRSYHCVSKDSDSISNFTNSPLSDAVCLNGEVRDGKIVKCTEVDTAIGAINTDPQGFVRSIFGFVLGISGGIALLLIIISGFRMMGSRGDPEKISASRDQLVSAIVGLLFIIFSFVILEIIGVNILRIPGFGE